MVGLKPTYGRVSRYGLVAYGSSLDQIGPCGRTVADVALMMNVIAGHDPADSTSVDETVAPVPDYLDRIDEPVDGLKIGVVPAFNAGAESSVQTALAAAIDVYRNAGAEVVEIDMPQLDYAPLAFVSAKDGR